MDERFEDCEQPVTSADLAQWAATHGATIPHAFAEYLLKYNGASLGLDGLVVGDGVEFSIERIYSVIHGAPNRLEDVLQRDYRPQGLFPLARGLGATEFCLRVEDGAVVYIAYDGTTDAPLPVADSFAGFIEAIVIDDDEDDEDDWL